MTDFKIHIFILKKAHIKRKHSFLFLCFEMLSCLNKYPLCKPEYIYIYHYFLSDSSSEADE